MKNILSFLWPIERGELKKFIPLGLMLFFTLFNYNALKALKDGFIVPNIGAEAISFVKFYFVVPGAILLVFSYMKMANSLSFNKIYFLIGGFFATFFLLFAFVLYPNDHHLHFGREVADKLSKESVDLFFFKLSLGHFKWFILILGKWLYALFYVIAELWGSAMTFMMFWQLCNKITNVMQAARLYPMLNLLGSAGNAVSGIVIQKVCACQMDMQEDAKALFTIQTLLSIVTVSTCVILCMFYFVTKKVVPVYLEKLEATEMKQRLSFFQSLKLILSSRYLGYIVIMIFCYGFAINVLEGPWKAKVRELYPSVNSYINFMGSINQWNGTAAILFSFVGVFLLKKYSWFTAAIATPLIIFCTGITFFTSVVFEQNLNVFVIALLGIEPLKFAVFVGALQVVISKGSKFGIFDSTKEMSYIPITEELKSKGKAVVDVLGSRFAKSAASFIQTLLFIVFPSATYVSIAPILMLLFCIVAIIWMVDVKLLNKEYLGYAKQSDPLKVDR